MGCAEVAAYHRIAPVGCSETDRVFSYAVKVELPLWGKLAVFVSPFDATPDGAIRQRVVDGGRR